MKNSPLPARDINTYYRSLQRSSSFCASQHVTGVSTSAKSIAVWTFPILCDRWECPRCGKIKAKRLRRKVRRSWGNKEMRHLMLSCNASAWNIETACKEINHSWDVFLKRLRRRWPHITFFKALEFTKAGYPHLHILLDTYIPQHYISRLWKQLFRSPYVFIAQRPSISAIRYITNYATKWAAVESGFACLHFIYKLRRYSYSRDFFTAQARPQKRIFYRGCNDQEARRIYDKLSTELATTYRIDSVGTEGNVLFLKRACNSPPDVTIPGG